jgi:hypothetical protein
MPKQKPWNVIFPNGQKEIVNNLKQFCQMHKLFMSNVVYRSYGHKGFKAYKVAA